MAVYVYKALNEKGRQIKGVIDAESVRSARRQLKAKGIYPTSLEEGRAKKTKSFSFNDITANRGTKVSVSQLAIITRQFSTLVAAGMPLVDSLKALSDQIEQTAIRTVLADVTARVNEGSTLALALREHPGMFPRLYVNMVSSGESSGSLDMVLLRLADLLEAQAGLRRKIVSALTYPVLMVVLCCSVIMLLLGYVVPQITSIFEDQGATLPLPTRIIIAMSDFVQSYWWLVIGLIVAGVFGFGSYVKTERGRRKVDRLLLRVPIIGTLKLKIATSRLARNLGMMLESGIELLTAMNIAKNIIGSITLEEAVEQAREGVREGKNLSLELKKTGYFPKLLIHMVAIGEKTGQLENMLQRAADAYESEVDSVISGFTSILEPVLIIFLAGVVGAILAAVMLPMMEMTSLVR